MQVLLNSTQLQLTIKRLAHQLLENHADLSQTVFIGLQPRGLHVATRIVEQAKLISGNLALQFGVLDITFYRDDIRKELHIPKSTDLLHSIEGRKVVLIDDVLYTGRTIRAALDALQDFGRPVSVELCVLVNRRFGRELPIQPDYFGVAIDTLPSQKVKIDWDKEAALLY